MMTTVASTCKVLSVRTSCLFNAYFQDVVMKPMSPQIVEQITADRSSSTTRFESSIFLLVCPQVRIVAADCKRHQGATQTVFRIQRLQEKTVVSQWSTLSTTRTRGQQQTVP